MAIDGWTKLVGLFGWPVEHSLSPQMHNAAFRAQGLNWRYLPFPVAPADLPRAVAGLQALGIRGVNVTVPHKQAIVPLLDQLHPEAQALGAVNTVVISPKGLLGYNTDAIGIQAALTEAAVDVGGSAALLLGAGGAARAAAYALLAGGARVKVLARKVAQAHELRSQMEAVLPEAALAVEQLDAETLVRAAGAANLLVQATPVGMWPHTDRSLWPQEIPFPPHLTAFDLVYRPRRTMLLQQALAAGAPIVEGLGMLVHQGAASYGLWTEQTPPISVLRAACEEALAEENTQGGT